jgi:pantoate--beta-alanine ligase
MIRVVHDGDAFREACDAARAQEKRVGLVPTMGALHEGHLSLIREARSRADFVALSLFVNPLQFAAGEDLSRYPRTFEADLDACEREGVDVVFAPEPAAMYPPGFQTHVEVEELTRPLEGEFRPAHFRGVTTVVTKLFNLTGPCVAVFGRKDFQQAAVLARMARDLDMPVEVVTSKTVREPDGLALSSRNRYLDPGERARALSISRGLRAAHDAFHAGERDAERLRALVLADVEAGADSIDYVAVVHRETLTNDTRDESDLVALVAARIGNTRLIDNCVFATDERP